MENNFTTGRLLAFIRNQVGNPADLTTEAKANVVAALNELEERFDHYEPKLQFDQTPVYSVTLAEAVTASAETPYEVVFGGAYDEVIVSIASPTFATQTYGHLRIGQSERLPITLRVNGLYSVLETERIGNARFVNYFANSSGVSGAGAIYRKVQQYSFSADGYTALVLTSGTYDAGTVFDAYGGKYV